MNALDVWDGISAAPNTIGTLSEGGGCSRLLERVMELRSNVGDGLSDGEFTELMKQHFPAAVGGFSLLCFSEGCLLFSVPGQKLEDWYPPDRWIDARKEELARQIAERYELTLCEPPDRLGEIITSPKSRHHLEFLTRMDTVAVAHPLYLKVRLFCTRTGSRIMWTPKAPLPPREHLMKDLAGLYA